MTLPFMSLLKYADRTVSNYGKRLLARILIPALLVQKFALLTVAGILGLSPTAALAAEEYFSNYASGSNSTRIDLGIQPLGYPSGVISALMRRDQILKNALEQSQQSLKTYPFMRGADMLTLFANSRLEAGLLGDMPTILSAATGQVWIVGLVKQSFTSIVAKDSTQVRDLVGPLCQTSCRL